MIGIVGETPLKKANKFAESMGLDGANIFVKLENYNPAGSIKDRVAFQMISDAENSGKISKGATLIEPTSGNTGIGLSYFADKMGYKAIIVMPDNMSKERIEMIEKYGAEVVLSDGFLGMKGAIEKANEIQSSIPGSMIMGQFYNPSNPKAHKLSTGPEIWKQMDGKVDVLVAGVGTGGTITGIGEYLKEKSDVYIVAVEPKNSAILSSGKTGSHGIQGIGAGFVPENLNIDIVDEVITVSDEDAFEIARKFRETENESVGISSGAALYAAMEIAKKDLDKNIVVIIPDSGDRYYSTKLF